MSMVDFVIKSRPHSTEHSAYDNVVEDMADDGRNVIPVDLNIVFAFYLLGIMLQKEVSWEIRSPIIGY